MLYYFYLPCPEIPLMSFFDCKVEIIFVLIIPGDNEIMIVMQEMTQR